jgi:isopentenyl phosphate kinase
VVLAGEVDGIFSADPQVDPTAQPIQIITPETAAGVRAGIGESHGVDVTGGMASKIDRALAMISICPDMEVIICSGLVPGNLMAALTRPGCPVGTRIGSA